MAFGRVIMGVACLAAAGAAEAATPRAVRLPLDVASLGPGPEIVYRSYRRLSAHHRGAAMPVLDVAGLELSPIGALRSAGIMSGNVHPFGDNLRLSVGFRQDRNRRLLRMNGDEGETHARRYAPLFAVGIAGEAVPGLLVAADIGLLGRSFSFAESIELVTPVEHGDGRGRDRLRTLVQISADYRF